MKIKEKKLTFSGINSQSTATAKDLQVQLYSMKYSGLYILEIYSRVSDTNIQSAGGEISRSRQLVAVACRRQNQQQEDKVPTAGRSDLNILF